MQTLDQQPLVEEHKAMQSNGLCRWFGVCAKNSLLGVSLAGDRGDTLRAPVDHTPAPGRQNQLFLRLAPLDDKSEEKILKQSNRKM
jgi:hypothetical protein